MERQFFITCRCRCGNGLVFTEEEDGTLTVDAVSSDWYRVKDNIFDRLKLRFIMALRPNAILKEIVTDREHLEALCDFLAHADVKDSSEEKREESYSVVTARYEGDEMYMLYLISQMSKADVFRGHEHRAFEAQLNAADVRRLKGVIRKQMKRQEQLRQEERGQTT